MSSNAWNGCSFGQREPGHVLYPSDDEMAWVIATRADELREYFQIFEPQATAIEKLLDKKALNELCCAIEANQMARNLNSR